MANHFRETAERLREIAATAAHISSDQQADLLQAASTLCRLEQLKRNLLSSAMADDSEEDLLAAELMSLLGLHVGS